VAKFVASQLWSPLSEINPVRFGIMRPAGNDWDRRNGDDSRGVDRSGAGRGICRCNVEHCEYV